MKYNRGILILLAFFLLLFTALYPPDLYSLVFPDDRGDSAMAERYAVWIKNLIDEGYWADALSALERASDFADVSSDISYLLALVRSHEIKNRGSVLEALELALMADRWNLFSSEDARLLKAEQLIALRAYPDALIELSRVSKSPRETALSLKTLAAFRPMEFRRFMADTLTRYPRESEPARIFFRFLANNGAASLNPEKEDEELLSLIIRRLPVLLPEDPELAWMAAPYMRDTAEARRLVSAYRAIHVPDPASLPVAPRLGVIDEYTALEELFDAAKSLDLALLDEIWELLRIEEAKEVFRRNLSAYTGVITEDADKDGIPETFAEYYEGMIRLSSYDVNQSGIQDLVVYYEAGVPHRAAPLIPPEALDGLSRKSALVRWERYPSITEVEFDGARYISRPFDFHYSPVKFIELWGSGALFPQRDPLNPPLTRRVLVSQSLRVERPSLEFSGGIEVVELNQGIPVRAREYVGDLMVSETEFLRGRPQLQRVDLDLDGHMETVRHFRRSFRAVELEELWDYDRDIDYTVTVHNWGEG